MTAKEAKAIAEDHKRLIKNVETIKTQFGIDAVAKAMGKSIKTLYNRLEGKNSFEYDELRGISRVLGVNFVTIVDGEVKLG